MTTIHSYMSADHRACDEIYAKAEAAVSDGDWQQAANDYRAFADALTHHLKMEEERLFPEFEQRTGMTGGPTQMMRMEHEQMRQQLTAMKEALDAENADDYLGEAETLMILIQQHNMKEEQILYPMCDQAIGGDAASLIEQMQQV